MKTKYLKLMIVWLGLMVAISQGAHSQQTFSVSQLSADFALFRQALREAHPGLYRYNSRQQIDSLFAHTESLLTHEMTQQQFYRILLPVVAQIRCGHTKLHPESNWADNYYYGPEKLFPLKLFFSDRKGYIADSYENIEKLPVGAAVTAINHQPMEAIMDRLLAGFFSDGNNTTFKLIEMSKFFSAYYANLVEAPDTFVIGYLKDDQPGELKLAAIPRTKIDLYEKAMALRHPAKAPYSLEFLPGKVARLTISSFAEDGPTMSYNKFLKHAFAEINERGTAHLIIDVRDNEGGKDKRGALLLSYLTDQKFRYYDRLEAATDKKCSFARQAYLPKFYGLLRMLIRRAPNGAFLWTHHQNLKVQQPQKRPYSGKVYVLINGASFSVTSEFAAVTHSLKRATFIGEETGGGYYGNNSGTFAIVPLTHSRLVVGIPMLAYYTAVNDYPFTDRGLIPDYEVKPGINDVLEGKDTVLDYTLELIGRKEPFQAKQGIGRVAVVGRGKL